MSVAAVTQEMAALRVIGDVIGPTHPGIVACIAEIPGMVPEIARLISAYDERGQYFLQARSNEDLLRAAASSTATALDLSQHAFLDRATAIGVIQRATLVERVVLPPAVAASMLSFCCANPIQSDRVRVMGILLRAPHVEVNRPFVNAAKAGVIETALDWHNREVAALELAAQDKREQAAASNVAERLQEALSVRALIVQQGGQTSVALHVVLHRRRMRF